MQQTGEARKEVVADAARSTDENTRSEECNHTSGGVSVAVTATCELWSTKKKKEPSCLSLGMSQEVCGLLPCTFGTPNDGIRGMRR